MLIDDKLIDYLEELSRLRLTGAEREDAKENLGRILGYIDKMSELDTTGVEPLSHPFPFVNCFREDEETASFDRELILGCAPRRKDGCFKVPRTVE